MDLSMQNSMDTPWKFNIAPENIPSQKESGLPTIIFQWRAVKLRGCKATVIWKNREHDKNEVSGPMVHASGWDGPNRKDV